MPQHKQHADSAARQKAYRLRVAAEQQRAAATTGAIPTPRQATKQGAGAVKKLRPPSRPARIAALDAATQTLHDEYEAWRDATPENLQGSDTWQSLDETVGLLAQILELIGQLDPPRGFGR
jgi:hypothetical protein